MQKSEMRRSWVGEWAVLCRSVNRVGCLLTDIHITELTFVYISVNEKCAYHGGIQKKDLILFNAKETEVSPFWQKWVK